MQAMYTGRYPPGLRILAVLSDHDGDHMHAHDLGNTLGWEKSRVPHQVRRVRKDGLSRREPNPDDARSTMFCLLPTGRAAIEKAAPGTRLRMAGCNLRRLLVRLTRRQALAAGLTARPGRALGCLRHWLSLDQAGVGGENGHVAGLTGLTCCRADGLAGAVSPAQITVVPPSATSSIPFT